MRRGVSAYAGTATAIVLAAIYLFVDPKSADLAAQTFRTRIAEDYGFAIYNPYWYGGHHLPGYSLLTPPLFALIGPQLAGAIAAVVASFAFERLAHRYERATPAAAVIASCWFAVAMVATTLVTGRLTFAVGAALALVALALLPRIWSAALTGALAGLASPVAAAFLALALLVWAWHSRRYREAATVGVMSIVPAAALMLLFPGGGSFPFVLAALLPTLAATVVLYLATPKDQRLLRKAVLAIAALVAVSGLVVSPMGGNATRPGALLAGSIAILALWPDHRRRLLLLAPVLLYWQLSTPFDDWWQARDDPSVQAAFYEPLKNELAARTGGAPVRVEVPFTDNHWESAHLAAGNVMLARGWERQLDRKVNRLFYEDASLTSGRYRRWLYDNAVHYVALPNAPLDYSAAAEAELIRARPSYLREVWRNRHWQLFAVENQSPLADKAVIVKVTPDHVRLRASRAGDILLRMTYTRYWQASGGAKVRKAQHSRWTVVSARRAGPIELRAGF
jgi:hypothetical protein